MNHLASSQPLSYRRTRWTPLASIAAVLLLVLAGVGFWQTSQSSADPAPSAQHAGLVPGGEVAQAPATAEVAATAVVETPASVLSVPIVQMVDEQPMDGPVIWLTTDGSVMYDDGMETRTIATGATQVMPQTTNVIQVITDAPEKDWVDKEGNAVEGYTVTYHNLVTGMSLVDDGSFSSYLGGPNTFGPLTVLTVADAPREWSIVNFETMESASISELTGGMYRSSESINITVSDDYSTIAVGSSQYQSEASSILMRQSGLPGEVAVIPADLSGVTWVSVPADMPGVGNISLSPDGSTIALISADYSGAGSILTVSVIDVASGEELVRVGPIESNSISHVQWTADGAALVVIAETSVQAFPVDGSAPVVLLESEGSIQQMPNMAGSSLIYLEVSSVSLGNTTPEPATTELAMVDPATGETVRVPGDPWYLGGSYPVTFTVGLSPIPVSQDGRTAALVHPITGEVFSDVVANVDDPMLRPDVDPEEGQAFYTLQTVTTAQRQPVSVVELADGNLAVVTTTPETLDVRTVERPEGSEGKQVQLSPGGEHLLIGAGWESQGEEDTFFLLDLTDPDATWVESEPGARLVFAEVAGD